MPASKRVEFSTQDGVKLRGDYYAVSGSKSPIVVMTQGLTLLKEHYLPDWAARIQAAGIAALVFDHRGWGSSEGTPRNQWDPIQQAEDYHDAVIFAQTIEDIDPARVAIWGIGHSGGISMIAAGDDPNAKAVVLVMPWNSGALDAQTYPEGQVARAWEQRKARALGTGTGSGAELQAWDESAEQAAGARGTIMLHGDVPFNFSVGARKLSDATGTPWENKLTLESLYRISKIEPRDHIHKIAPKPLLYLAASDDPLSGPFEEQQKTFALAVGDKKEFVRLEGTHLNHYFNETFDRNMQVQVEWLKKNL